MTWNPSDHSHPSLWTKADVSRRSAWTKADIRRARHAPLKPVLESLGYRLLPLPGGNWRIDGLSPEIVVKDHYWICPDTGQAGNAMFTRGVVRSTKTDDFLVRVKQTSFNQAMQLLARPQAS